MDFGAISRQRTDTINLTIGTIVFERFYGYPNLWSGLQVQVAGPWAFQFRIDRNCVEHVL